MKKQFLFTGYVLLMGTLLTGCGKAHVWEEATCTSPKTCTECGITEGEALGHTWIEATCTSPRTCSVCGATEGEASGHTWIEATCDSPKTCSVCGTTEGAPLEHILTEATYQSAPVCTVCGKTIGEPLQAAFEEYGIVCDVEENVEYDYLSMDYPVSKEIPGKAVFTDYNTFTSDETHPEKEGYEWKSITISTVFDDLSDWGVSQLTGVFDYYTGNDIDDVNVITYNGAEYTIEEIFKVLRTEWQGDTYYYSVQYDIHVPVGYDGIVVFAMNWANTLTNPTNDDGSIIVYLEDFQKDTLAFRMK